jgi:parvulin-like peptidyl-prolyl isomerase
VEVSSADIEWMRTIFKKQMGRGPTAQDLKGQVNQLIREQILSREAVAMGIDEGDIVVRRRLAQKMEFLFKDLSAMTEPTEDDLRKYYFENRRKYEASPQLTFNQVYFSVENRGLEGAKLAAQALIKEDGDPNKVSTLGDASILSPGCKQCGEKEIRNRFGTDFAEAVKNLKPGSWNGPVKSAYGFHAVYIYERQDTKMPKFRDIIDRIKNDWMSAKREEYTRRIYGEIRSRYRVLVEGLPYDFDLKG